MPLLSVHRRLLSALLALCGLLLGGVPLAAQAPNLPPIPQAFDPVPAGRVAPSGLIDAGATDVRHVTLLNHLPGGFGRDIHVRGNYVYALVDQELVVFDVTDRSRPILVSLMQLGNSGYAAAQAAELSTAAPAAELSTAAPAAANAAMPAVGTGVDSPQSPDGTLGESDSPRLVSAITYDGDHAFALINSEIWTLSLADPARPVKQQVTIFDDQWPTSIQAQDGYLYVALQTELWVMAIQPDGTLVKAATYVTESEYSTFVDLLVTQDAVYLAVRAPDAYYIERDLIVLDIADPTAPSVAATLPGHGGYMMLTGTDHLYVFGVSPIDGYDQLVIYDRSDPHQLVELALMRPYGSGVAAWDGYLLLTDGAQGQLIDLSEPASPQLTGWMPRADAALAHGDQLYTLADGLHIYDRAALPDAVEVGTFNFFLLGPADSYVRDNTVLVQDQRGLHVLDLSSPLDLVKVAQVPSNVIGSRSPLVVDGDALYSSGNSLQTITDIADPTRPAVVGFHQGSISTVLAARDNLVYLYNYDLSKLVLMDTSTPSLWQELSSLNFTPAFPRMLLTGNRAYLSTPEGLVVLNVADPTQPRRVNTLPAYSGAILHLIEGDHLYKSAGYNPPSSSRLDVLDISKRNEPAPLSQYQLDTGPFSTIDDVAYQAPYLYVADASRGFYVLDAADPSLLLEAGRYLMTGGAYSIAAQETLISVTSFNSGLMLYRFNPPDETGRIEPTGGTLAAEGGGVTYTLPNGFVSTSISLTHSLRRFGPSPVLPPLAAAGLVFRNSAVDAATGEPVQAAAAYTLTIAIDDIMGSFPPETLTLYHWTGETWAAQASSVDTTNHEVTATTGQFGIFALMAKPHQLRLPHVRHTKLSSTQPIPAP